jgi:predicted small lipoprotein YifL
MSWKQAFKLLALALLLSDMTLGLAACGKKVPLKAPEGSTYPRRYPPPPPDP